MNILTSPIAAVLPSISALNAVGFLAGGVVRALNVTDGKVFIQTLADHLKDESDLIEGLAGLNDHFRQTDPRYSLGAFDFYGPWRPEGEKDINATLRSLGMYRERWDGNKSESLFHPFGNRANPVIQAAELYLNGQNIIGRLSECIRWELVLPRLEVESFIVDLYLSRPAWMEALQPGLALSRQPEWFANMASQNGRLKNALGVLAKYFGNNGSPG